MLELELIGSSPMIEHGNYFNCQDQNNIVKRVCKIFNTSLGVDLSRVHGQISKLRDAEVMDSWCLVYSKIILPPL